MARLGSKPAGQGGVASVHIAPSRMSGVPRARASMAPGQAGGSTNGYQRHVTPVGGSGKTAAGPKPFRTR